LFTPYILFTPFSAIIDDRRHASFLFIDADAISPPPLMVDAPLIYLLLS